ncbi:MAG: hypothetical protein LBQ75_08765 [Zoogloeaceae bacterium]|jgi:hypothetical protein|nr:hypothetical protein [Zoogloeaceae bacterium]
MNEKEGEHMDDKNLRNLVWSWALVTLMALLPSGAWAVTGPVGYLIGPIGVVVILIYTGAILMVARLLNKLVLWLLQKLGWRRDWWLSWRWGVLGLPVLVLSALPWAEEYWISSHFREACKDAGVKIYRQVEVEGFYDGAFGEGNWYITKHGFRFTEYDNIYGSGIQHVEKRDGQLYSKTLEHPTARFHVKFVGNRYEKPIGWKLEKLEYQAVDSLTGEILGKNLAFRRVLPTYEALWIGLFEPAIVLCRDPHTSDQPRGLQLWAERPPLPLSVFKPIDEPTKAH